MLKGGNISPSPSQVHPRALIDAPPSPPPPLSRIPLPPPLGQGTSILGKFQEFSQIQQVLVIFVCGPAGSKLQKYRPGVKSHLTLFISRRSSS